LPFAPTSGLSMLGIGLLERALVAFVAGAGGGAVDAGDRIGVRSLRRIDATWAARLARTDVAEVRVEARRRRCSPAAARPGSGSCVRCHRALLFQFEAAGAAAPDRGGAGPVRVGLSGAPSRRPPSISAAREGTPTLSVGSS
jgi:hypothetical protein